MIQVFLSRSPFTCAQVQRGSTLGPGAAPPGAGGQGPAWAVSTYLQTHTQPGREVFSLRDGMGQATFAMAEEFARGDAVLMVLWRCEQEAADARQDGH